MSWKETTKELLGGIPIWLSITWVIFLVILLVGIAVSTCSCELLKYVDDIKDIRDCIDDKKNPEENLYRDYDEDSLKFNVKEF